MIWEEDALAVYNNIMISMGCDCNIIVVLEYKPIYGLDQTLNSFKSVKLEMCHLWWNGADNTPRVQN